MVEMIPIQDDSIDSMGYDESANSLHIKFEDTTECIYQNIPIETFIDLLYSKTKQEYLQNNIVNQYLKVAV